MTLPRIGAGCGRALCSARRAERRWEGRCSSFACSTAAAGEHLRGSGSWGQHTAYLSSSARTGDDLSQLSVELHFAFARHWAKNYGSYALVM